MRYDPLYPSLRPAVQACNRLGGRLRRDHSTPVARFVNEIRLLVMAAAARAGSRRASRLDLDPSRPSCSDCGTTFTFLPLLSLPYTHYSLLARCPDTSAALCGGLLLGEGVAEAQGILIVCPIPPQPAAGRGALTVLRRRRPFSARPSTRTAHWLDRCHQAVDETGPLSWITPVLQNLWPLLL